MYFWSEVHKCKYCSNVLKIQYKPKSTPFVVSIPLVCPLSTFPNKHLIFSSVFGKASLSPTYLTSIHPHVNLVGSSRSRVDSGDRQLKIAGCFRPLSQSSARPAPPRAVFLCRRHDRLSAVPRPQEVFWYVFLLITSNVVLVGDRVRWTVSWPRRLISWRVEQLVERE